MTTVTSPLPSEDPWKRGGAGGAFAETIDRAAKKAVRGPTVEPFAITAAQDRAFAPFADGQVDGSCRPRDERNGGGLVALAEDAQRAMAAFDAEVLDVDGARLAHSQSGSTREARPERRGRGRPLDGSFDLQVCADTVAEFLFRFWVENEVFFASGAEPVQSEAARYAMALRVG